MGAKLGSWGDNMHSRKLGRAAAAAGLMALLLPSAAIASWWDGGYDRRYDSGYDSRRADSAPPRDEPPESDIEPAFDEPVAAPDCPQRDCGPPAESDCGPSGCTRYTPPPDDNPPPQCGPQGCQRYTPPSDCAQPCDAPPPPACGPPACGEAPPPPPPPPPPPAFYEPIYGCENSTLSDVQFVLHKKTSPPPGTPVRPGDEILVDITWDWWTFAGPEIHKAMDCVYINGLFAPELSGGERPALNDGHFGFHYFVPLDVPPGSEICDQGFVSGPTEGGWEEYGRTVSNIVCFPVVAPPPPPPPPVATACCEAPPPPPPTTCCEPPPTTCCAQSVETEALGPYLAVDTDSTRFSQEEELPRAALPEVHAVLPRTGSDAGTARLAAAALATATLIRRRVRRR